MRHPDELAQLPPVLREEIERLHQQAHSSEDGSGGSASRGDEESGQHLSSTTPTFPKSTPEIPETVRTVQNNVCKVPTYCAPQAEMPKQEMLKQEIPEQKALARFRRLAADQQNYLSGRLRELPAEQRRDVLAEWSVRCAAGAVRDAAAYLFGLIRKALQGTFRLWAARKYTGQERPAPKVQEAPREIPRPTPTSGITPTEPADKPASREVAAACIQRMKAILQGTANAAQPVRTTKPPERRLLVRAVAQAMPSTGPVRPLSAFLMPVMETGR
jgi:hypothetical protein